MRMKSRFMGALEIQGQISDLRTKEGWLIMEVRTTTPVGWNLSAALTHNDLMSLIKLMFKPSNIKYLLFGINKPDNKDISPDY